MIRKLLIFIFLPCVALAGWNPVNFKKWQDSEVDTLYQKRIGGEYANYEQGGDSGWAVINNDWVASGDSAYTCNTSILKTHVDSSGKSVVSILHNGNTYTASSKLNRLMWLRTDTWDTLTIFTDPNWGNYSMDSNIVNWTNVFPQVDYRIRKRNGGVEHGIFFKKAFLDSAVILFNGLPRSDSANIALANVIVYTLSANVDDHDVALGNVNKRKLKQLGEHYFGIADARLFFPGSDTLSRIPINHRWLKWNNKIICVEYVKMGRIKQIHEAYPNEAIWHNSELTIDGTTNVEDTYMSDAGGKTNYNYGEEVGAWYGDDFRTLLRFKNLSSLLPAQATISAAICSVNVYVGYSSGEVISVWRVLKPWGEGTNNPGINPGDAPVGEGVATFLDWSNDGEEWGDAGCENASDAGDDNSTDGGGWDRLETAETTWANETVGWRTFDIASLAQEWYDGTANENGVMMDLTAGSDGASAFIASETSPTDQPRLVITYTTSGGATGQVIMIMGN